MAISSWESVYGNERQTGIQSIRGNFSNRPVQKWEYTFINTSGASNVNCISPLVGDIDNDGQAEIITAPLHLNNADSRLYAFDGTTGAIEWTKLMPILPGAVAPWFYTTGALGNINDDDSLEIAIPTINGGYWILNGANGDSIWHDTLINAQSPPIIKDLDGDGSNEITAMSQDGVFRMLNADRTTKWINASLGGNGGPYNANALLDINNDNVLDVLLVVMQSPRCSVVALNGNNGNIIWQVPINHNGISGFGLTPVIFDLDNDDVPEILVTAPNANEVLALEPSSGNTLWTKTLNASPVGSPSAGDIDLDGVIEIIVGTNDGKVIAFSSKNLFNKWSFQLPNRASNKLVIGDHDPSTPKYEILAANIGDTSEGAVYLIDHEGNEIWNYREPGLSIGHMVVADIDNDNSSEIVLVSAHGTTLPSYEQIVVLDDDQNTTNMRSMQFDAMPFFEARDSLLCLADPCTDFIDSSHYVQFPIPYPDNLWYGEWRFEGANPAFSFDRYPSNICYNDAGKYDVTIVLPTFWGVDTFKKENHVEVFDTTFSLPWHDSTVCEGQSANLEMDNNWDSILWSDGNIEFNRSFATTVALDVKLKHINGCKFEKSMSFATQPCNYFIPNAFSPDGAEYLNNDFKMISTGFLNYELNIYDRFGKLVKKLDEQDEVWDGTENGELSVSGVYTYYLDGLFEGNLSITETGTIMLLGDN